MAGFGGPDNFDGVIDEPPPFDNAADPYALNDIDNMVEEDPEKGAFIN